MLCYITVIRGLITVIWCQTSTNGYITVILQLLSDVWFESQDPCFHWKRFDFKVCLWGRKVTSRTFNKRVRGWHKFVYCTRIIWYTAEESVNAFVYKKKQLTLLYVHLTSLCASVLWAKLVEEHCYQVYSPTELRLPRH